MKRQFRQIDVFGAETFAGNPVAVIVDGDGLTVEQMSRISAWTNLSECTFVQTPTDPEADYRLRIFCLEDEIPFAGHPTLGSARAWLDAGGVPRTAGVIVQECGAGLVEITIDEERLAFAAPPIMRGGDVASEYLAEVCAVLGISTDDVVDSQWLDNGAGWVGVLLKDADAVLALEPALTDASTRWDIGVIGEHAEGPAAFELRAFFTDNGGYLREDPVTGSLNASAAQWLLCTGRAVAPYVAHQGRRVGRCGEIFVSEDGGSVWVGGVATVAVAGEIDA